MNGQEKTGGGIGMKGYIDLNSPKKILVYCLSCFYLLKLFVFFFLFRYFIFFIYVF